MEKEIEINLKSLLIGLGNEYTQFTYCDDKKRCYRSGTSFLNSLNLDSSSSNVVAYFIDYCLRYSSALCNLFSINITEFGRIDNFKIDTDNGMYAINVESLKFRHTTTKYIDLYNNISVEDKQKIINDYVLRYCSNIDNINVSGGQQIFHISKPSDVDHVACTQWMEYDCKRCGKRVIKEFKDYRCINAYKMMLCRVCNQKQVFFEKYGVENPFQSSLINERRKRTLLEKYGVEYPTQSPVIKERAKQTLLERYGTDCAFNLPKCREFHCGNYRYLGLKFDSSWELYYYIYQTEIMKVECVRNIGKIYIEYFADGRIHRYYPDFITEGRIVEIKGDHLIKDNILANTYNDLSEEVLLAKTKCMLDNVDEVITRKEIMPIIKAVKREFGVHYIDQFKVNKDEEGLKAS